jgi:hypothetical protein
VARLAATLELLSWSCGNAPTPEPVGEPQMMRAISLWRDYFWPHARAFLDHAAPTDVDRRARRVVHWLRATGAQLVSREDIRRHALSRTVNAAAAEAVLHRLTDAGIVQIVVPVISPEGGRPVWRWQVNPAFATLNP